MNVEKELRSYEKSSFEKPKTHGQTCLGYGMMATFLTCLLLITASVLLAVAVNRKSFNATLQQTVCYVDSSTMTQNKDVILNVHYETIDFKTINSTWTTNIDGLHHYYGVPQSFSCFYFKKDISKLADVQNDSVVFIPSMILFGLAIFPPIFIVAYYFLYWKKLQEEEPSK